MWALWRATRSGAENSSLPLTRLSVDLGPDALTGINLTAAISPDGRRLVFPARAPNGKQQLATRLLDQAQASLLPGTENGSDPFFSPDSQWVGFFASGKLKKISVQGGAPVTVVRCPVSLRRQLGGRRNHYRGAEPAVPPFPSARCRGRPQPVTRLGKGEFTHRWPQILPGGQALLFTAAPTGVGMENASVAAISLPSGVTKTLIAGGYFGRYLPANGTRGYLVYLHQGVLSGWPSTPSGWSFKARLCRFWRMWLQARCRAEASLTFPRHPPGTGPWCTWKAKGRHRPGR